MPHALLLIISGSNERYSKQCHLQRITVVLVMINLLIVETFCCQAFLVAIIILSRFDFSTVVGFSFHIWRNQASTVRPAAAAFPGSRQEFAVSATATNSQVYCAWPLSKQFPVGIAGKDRHCWLCSNRLPWDVCHMLSYATNRAMITL
jgi:hypothetical protein